MSLTLTARNHRLHTTICGPKCRKRADETRCLRKPRFQFVRKDPGPNSTRHGSVRNNGPFTLDPAVLKLQRQPNTLLTKQNATFPLHLTILQCRIYSPALLDVTDCPIGARRSERKPQSKQSDTDSSARPVATGLAEIHSGVELHTRVGKTGPDRRGSDGLGNADHGISRRTAGCSRNGRTEEGSIRSGEMGHR